MKAIAIGGWCIVLGLVLLCAVGLGFYSYFEKQDAANVRLATGSQTVSAEAARESGQVAKPFEMVQEDQKTLPNTNAEIAAERDLLAAFPQLSWSRAKLEFIFEKKAELGSSVASGANTGDAAFKLAKEMEPTFKNREEIKTFTEGWKMTGKLHSKTVDFTKAKYTLSGITGEIDMLFNENALISLSFWTDGSDTDFASLYKMLVRACHTPGERTTSGKDDSEIKWSIVGSPKSYEVKLSHRRWGKSGELERGMTIFVTHAK